MPELIFDPFMAFLSGVQVGIYTSIADFYIGSTNHHPLHLSFILSWIVCRQLGSFASAYLMHQPKFWLDGLSVVESNFIGRLGQYRHRLSSLCPCWIHFDPVTSLVSLPSWFEIYGPWPPWILRSFERDYPHASLIINTSRHGSNLVCLSQNLLTFLLIALLGDNSTGFSSGF